MNKNAVIYTRVSTKGQAEEGYSLVGQEKDCRLFAKSNNFEVVEVFTEKGESAKTQDRTELKNLIRFCSENRKNIDAIIIWKIDRLTRDVGDYHNLQALFAKLNIKILYARENNGDSAVDKLTRNMMSVLAQFENDQKSERVSAGMKEAFLQGHWMWKAPVGYIMQNGNIEPDPATAHHVQKVFKLFATGMYQQVDIIKIMEKDGFKMNTNMICRMLKNPLYKGYMYKKEWFEEPIRGLFEPLVSETEFQKVQNLLNGKKPLITGYKRNNPLYPLRQFITCPNCNQPLTGSKSRGRKERYPYYHCYNKDCSISYNIGIDRIHDEFINYLKIIKPEDNLINLFKAAVSNVFKEKKKSELDAIDKITQQIDKCKLRKTRLIDLKLDGGITQEDYELKTAQLTEELTELELKIVEVGNIETNIEKCLNYTCNAIKNIDMVWQNGNLEIKQRLQKLIFPKGVTYDLDKFRTAEISSLFKIIGTLSVPSYNMVPPSEFESLSTP